MGRRKQKKIGKEKQTSDTLVCPSVVTAEEWKLIIVDALIEVDKEKSNILEAKSQEGYKIWQKAVGIEDYSTEKIPKRWILIFFNTIKALAKISFISKEDIQGDRVTFTLLQLSAKFCFSVADISLLIISFYLFFIHPFIIATHVVPPLLWSEIFLSLSWGFLAIVFSRLFHVASLEVDNIKNRDYLFGLISSLTAVISIVLSIVALLNN